MRISLAKFLTFSVLGLTMAGCSQHKPMAKIAASYDDSLTAPVEFEPRKKPKKHHGFSSAKENPFAGEGAPYFKGGKRIPFGGGKYVVGKPYKVAGKTYTPKEEPGYEKVGMASWYGEDFHGRKTSNGEWFDLNTLTAAHPTLPLPSYALVTNLENNREVVVRVNDRGPFVGTRVIDLSKKAADVLGYRAKGKAKVRVKWIGPAPKIDSMERVVSLNIAARKGAGVPQLKAMSHYQTDVDNISVASTTVAKRIKRAPRPLISSGTIFKQPQFLQKDTLLVMLGTFQSVPEAQDAGAKFADLGQVKLSQTSLGVKVVVGPFSNRNKAKLAMARAREEGLVAAKLQGNEEQQAALY